MAFLLLFLWNVVKLQKEVTSVQRQYERLCPILGSLIQDRGDAGQDQFRYHPDQISDTRTRVNVNPTTMRRDCDDLQFLDEAMKKEIVFRGPWKKYRRTLVLEHVPWFMEPRLFSTRRAENVLTLEAIIESRINLSFYHQFPSLLTSLGLLFTFLALFVGLGKLHAEGNEIIGIQGLINGLAGKFLTSIVGLMVAHLFAFVEKPLIARLTQAHHTFLGLVDQLFPHKTMEQMLERLTSMHGQPQRENVRPDVDFPAPAGGLGIGLAGPMASLTSSIQSLTALQETAPAETRRIMEKLPGIIREELHGSLQELTQTIHELTAALKKAPHLARVELGARSRPLLWKAPPDLLDSSEEQSIGKPKSWPRWPRMSMERRSG